MTGYMEGKERRGEGRKKRERKREGEARGKGLLINDAVSWFNSYKMAWTNGRDVVPMVKTLPFTPNSPCSVGG